MHGSSDPQRRSARTFARTALLPHILTCVALLLSYSLAAASRTAVFAPMSGHPERARYEETLAHDDGTAESAVTGMAGQKVAVGFQAPEWATHVIGMEFYVMNDQVANPYDPQLPSTMPFIAWIWRPNTSGLPGPLGNDGYLPFPEPYSYPEEAWVRFYFPNPVDITDAGLFPDRRFFAGIEWENRLNPYIGVDTDPPCAYESFRWNWSEWELREDNVMIRVIVWTDTICVPEVIHVDAAGGGDFLAIQDAVDAASACDTVVVAPGTYTGPGNRGISFGGKSVVLRSQEGRAETVIDCEHQDRGFFFVDGESEEATVRGFTVKNGLGSGAGIRCVNSWPTIIDCAFTDGDGENYGGGVYCNNSVSPSPSFTGCVFADNAAAMQGGGVLMDFSEATFTNCTFVGNGAPEGGGIHCGTNSTPVFTNCIVAFGTNGGAVYCPVTSVPSFTNCCVSGNAGGDGLCGDAHENMFEDPLFCGTSLGDYSLFTDSPCLPGNNEWGVQIGALGYGCDGTVVEETTWGAIKAMYR